MIIPDDEWQKIKEVFLDAANHLEYCGYGDSWERQGTEELHANVDMVVNILEKY